MHSTIHVCSYRSHPSQTKRERRREEKTDFISLSVGSVAVCVCVRVGIGFCSMPEILNFCFDDRRVGLMPHNYSVDARDWQHRQRRDIFRHTIDRP